MTSSRLLFHAKNPRLTIKQLVNDDKVILDRLLVDLSKVRLGNGDEAVAVLKHKCSIRIAFRHTYDIDVVDAHMEEAGRAQCDDRRAHIAVRDNLYPEDVRDRASAPKKGCQR